MWKSWISGLAIGLFSALVLYLALDKFANSSKLVNFTSSENLAEVLAEDRAVQQQITDLSSKGDDGTSTELEQDIATLKTTLANVSAEVKKACAPAQTAQPTSPDSPQTSTRRASDVAQAPLTFVDPRWQDVQASIYKVQREYFALEQRYSNGTQSPYGGPIDPSTAVARSEIEDLSNRAQSMTRSPWGTTTQPPPNAADTCKVLEAHRSLVNVESSPIVAPLVRVKQRLERQRTDNQSKIAELKQRSDKLQKELALRQERVAEGPKLVVVKYLPLAMAIILAFGGLLFLAARIIPEPVLMQLVQSGQLIQFPTVVILFAVILVLALADGLSKEHTATLLAAIAGYILGSTRTSANGDKASPRGPAPNGETSPQVDPAPPGPPQVDPVQPVQPEAPLGHRNSSFS
ncbi:MAG TPA: hypothetical protein VER96_04200 [Polyangiaceae bacterium]|nr:hypothetical protein [Polyangiaceae bacterium]